MSGLVLSLKAEEKFLVNGALLINGSKRSQIRIGGDDVNVLRLSDAMHPREITTPVRRVYYDPESQKGRYCRPLLFAYLFAASLARA